MNARTIMRRDTLADTPKYREAVARAIADIRRATGKTLVDIAEEIDVSLGTISKAARQESDLGGTFLFRLGQTYGAAFLNPCFAICDAQAAPIEKRALKDILPIAARFVHKVASARDPAGPGGATEVPQEKRAYLPDLKELNHETGCLISEIEAAHG